MLSILLARGRGCETGGMSQNSGPLLQSGFCRLPAFAKPLLKQLIRRWLVRPDGDRRQLATSGHAEDQELALGVERNQQIMVEFILRDHVETGER